MVGRMPGQQPILDEIAGQDQRARDRLNTEQGRMAARAERNRSQVADFLLLILLVLLFIGCIVLARLS